VRQKCREIGSIGGDRRLGTRASGFRVTAPAEWDQVPGDVVPGVVVAVVDLHRHAGRAAFGAAMPERLEDRGPKLLAGATAQPAVVVGARTAATAIRAIPLQLPAAQTRAS
jgi:hypothetical protein